LTATGSCNSSRHLRFMREKQGRTWQVGGPIQDLGAGSLWALVLWRHRVQSTVLYDHGRSQIQSFTTRIEHVC